MKRQGPITHRAYKAQLLAWFLPHLMPCFSMGSPLPGHELLLWQRCCLLRLFLVLLQWSEVLFLLSLCWDYN